MTRRASVKMTAAFLFSLAGLCASAAHAAELITLGHADLLGAYSEIVNGDHDLGFDLSGYFSPTVKFNDTLFLIPLYSVQFNRVEQYLPEEEGNVFYNTYLVENFNLALRKEFRPDWFVTLKALGTWNFVHESHEEVWGRGLYDYRDAGVAVELKHTVKKDEMIALYLGAVEYYRRQYPNFATLISSASVTPPERREKDYDGYKLRLRAEAATPDGLRGYLEGRYLYKAFLDKHLVLEDGTLDTRKQRQDHEIDLEGGFSAPLPWDGFAVCLDSSYTHNFSDLGYYDSRNTVILTDDVYTPRYFGYDSFDVTPAVEYRRPVGEQKVLRLRLGYGYMHRYYSHRRSQDAAGNYLAQEQSDRQHEYFALLYIPLTKQIGFVTKYSWITARSNQKYEAYYRYNYDSYSIKSGISWDF
ncbi:MAG: hypothetical protein ACM3L6_07110 [Deltaproteobacteria bacterium]